MEILLIFETIPIFRTNLSPFARTAGFLAHLANVAIRLGRSSLDWNPVTEQFTGDDKANAMLHRPMRSRYAV